MSRNHPVKEAIRDATFSLMHEKKMEDITVSEIIALAGVSRMSFYRHYTCKENVVLVTIRDILDEYYSTDEYDISDVTSHVNLVRAFEWFHRYGHLILGLYHCGIMDVLLDEITQYREVVSGNMPASSILRYRIYMYAGALCNTAFRWLLEGEKETPEEMADVFLNVFP